MYIIYIYILLRCVEDVLEDGRRTRGLVDFGLVDGHILTATFTPLMSPEPMFRGSTHGGSFE